MAVWTEGDSGLRPGVDTGIRVAVGASAKVEAPLHAEAKKKNAAKPAAIRDMPGLTQLSISTPSARLVVRHRRDDVVRLRFADALEHSVHEVLAAQRARDMRVTYAERVTCLVSYYRAQL